MMLLMLVHERDKTVARRTPESILITAVAADIAIRILRTLSVGEAMPALIVYPTIASPTAFQLYQVRSR